ncbi:hypothetical protein [Gorillibacterium massiliense]|uniref:hypothetical protein n=1 Tax=Gorillibacterium massiliense TaxID=1280390 RepID=UPI00059380A0|nr:hypothetical protein [Gorillibacterium massiliense]
MKKKLDAKAYKLIGSWMYRNARPVDLARWRYHFENGSRDEVLQALSAYQNEDGGFGHALEADSWNPSSSPLTTSTAVLLLKEIGFSETGHPLAQGILNFLGRGEYTTDKGWPFTIPSNSEYPCAPWWSYSGAANAEMGFNPTAILVGFLLRFSDESSVVYEKALDLADQMVDKLRRQGHLEVHELQAYCTFLDDIGQAGLSERFDATFLAEALAIRVNEAIERDPAKWPQYTMRPSVYISSPGSSYYNGNEEIVEKELDYLLDTRDASGVWDITWNWGGYEKEFAISANWWRGTLIIENVKFLKAFGRVE